MATHSSILAWRIPWTEEPGRLQFMESQELDTNLALSFDVATKVQYFDSDQVYFLMRTCC